MGTKGRVMEFEYRVSMCRMILAEKHPFFGTLCFHADIRESESHPTAWTNGRLIWFNPDFARKLSDSEFMGVLLHEVLHCALMHSSRREDRDPHLYNIAADVVVNGMILEAGLILPSNHVRYTDWEKFSTEEVYALLVKDCPKMLKVFMETLQRDLIETIQRAEKLDNETYWEIASRNAAAQGRLGGGPFSPEWERLFSRLTAPQVDWRTQLWEFVVRTPCDYTGWDRRFIYRNLYLESLEGESCELNVCCDTSGSIGQEELGRFLSEIKGILCSYPQIKARLWFADWDLDGPHDLAANQDLPTPTGGGGTSFVPFFAELEKEEFSDMNSCAIYLTDGWGLFPDCAPPMPVLWVITPGGIENAHVPFGNVARLLR